MLKPRILIVEDEEKIRNVLRIYLEKENFTVEELSDGKNALEVLIEGNFALIILDIMLPSVDGWSICREIRKRTLTPIIILSARSQEYDKLFGFELGADDYVTKPFSPKELVARVHAVLNRSNVIREAGQEIVLENIRILPERKQVIIEDQGLYMTPKEFELLLYLVQNPNQVFSREQLLNTVWGYDYYGDTRTVDTHIKQLRSKLESARELIKTVWGSGYMLKTGE